jgi:hypothetical protein
MTGSMDNTNIFMRKMDKNGRIDSKKAHLFLTTVLKTNRPSSDVIVSVLDIPIFFTFV